MSRVKIKAEYLEGMDACEDPVAQFYDMWPDGMIASLKNIRACYDAGLDVGWFICKCLTMSAYNEHRDLLVKLVYAYRKRHPDVALDERLAVTVRLDCVALYRILRKHGRSALIPVSEIPKEKVPF